MIKKGLFPKKKKKKKKVTVTKCESMTIFGEQVKNLSQLEAKAKEMKRHF